MGVTLAFSSQLWMHEYYNAERPRDIASYKNLHPHIIQFQSRLSARGDTAHAGPFPWPRAIDCLVHWSSLVGPLQNLDSGLDWTLDSQLFFQRTKRK